MRHSIPAFIALLSILDASVLLVSALIGAVRL